MMTEYSENLSIVMSRNGQRSYYFETPLLEGYTMGAEPYREFRKGIKITTYQDDSLARVDMVLTANYAIYYEQRELWETRGDVVGTKSDGKRLYTQQLFWNARTKKIYSNVDTKLVQGNNVSVGESFEADEDLQDWRFRYQKSRVEVEVNAAQRDSTAAATPAPTFAEPAAPSMAPRRVEAKRGREQSKAQPTEPKIETPPLELYTIDEQHPVRERKAAVQMTKPTNRLK